MAASDGEIEFGMFFTKKAVSAIFSVNLAFNEKFSKNLGEQMMELTGDIPTAYSIA